MIRYPLVLLCLAVGMPAYGQVLPLEQERVLTVIDPGCPGAPDISLITSAQSDFLPWVWSLALPESSCGEGQTPFPVDATANQRSEITNTRLFASGTARAEFTFAEGPLPEEVISGATSLYRVQFVVTTPVDYELFGVGDVATVTSGYPAPGFMSGLITVQLRRLASSVQYADEARIEFVDFEEVASTPFSAFGLLVPGVYEFEVEARADVYAWFLGPDVSFSGETAYLVTLAFHEAGTQFFGADLDHDGDVDLADFAIFQQAMSGPGE